MKLRTKLALIVLAMIISTLQAFAQASSSMAELRGQVTDPTGAVVPNAKVTLTDAGKGAGRTVMTNGEGNYVFLGILPGAYSVQGDAKGFSPAVIRVELTVGQQANVSIRLATGSVQEKVEIAAGSEVIEVSRTQQSSVVEAGQIQNLPISRRNYLDYALLTPGVSDSDNIADSSDFRLSQTPQSGLSFGGNNGRGNYIAVDGGATLSGSGGPIYVTSQEAVQEFQVLRNSFNAEFGTVTGGVINTVTKSGANSLHGSGFGLFRNQRFDSRNVFDFNPDGKSPFNRQQFGGSLGGPIKRDRTFYFAAAESFHQRETSFVNLLRSPAIFQPTAGQTSLLDYLKSQPETAADSDRLRAMLTTTNFPRTVKLLTDSTGQFPFNSGQTLISARLDHHLSDRSNVYLRYSINDSRFENQAAGALTATSRGRTLDTFNQSALLSHDYQLSSKLFNELKFQHIYLRFEAIPNDLIGPEFNIEGFGLFGRDFTLPSKTYERHWDLSDNLSWVQGNHTLKFGGQALLTHISAVNRYFDGGRINFGSNLPLSTAIARQAGLGDGVVTGLSDFLKDHKREDLLAELSSPINALQAFNLDLPILYQQGFGDPTAKSWSARYGFYVQDAWRVGRNFTLNYGLRYSLNDEAFLTPTDKNDLQPRLGFAWDLFRNGKTVLRGGGGIFTGYTIYQVQEITRKISAQPDDPFNINVILATLNSKSFGLPDSIDTYRTVAALTNYYSRPVRPADLFAVPPPTSGVFSGFTPTRIIPRAGSPLEVRWRMEPNFESPSTYQASLGMQQDLGGGFSLDVSYLFTRGLHITRNRDTNQFKQTGPPSTSNPNGGPSFIRVPTPTQAGAGLTSDLRDPGKLQSNIYESSANSFYHAGTIQLQKRFARNFSLNAHYTFARAIDEVTDFNSDFSAQNPLNLRLDRGLSAFDQRHRLVISGVGASPFKNRWLKDWQLAPILIAGSGRPFNLQLGFDANGDGRAQTDRPGLAGRNTGTGAAFYSFDTRLARRLMVKDRRYLELTVEGFNLFNRANLAGINNIMGTSMATASDFRVHGALGKLPTEPLGFTSAANKRQLQFGARFNF